MHMQWIVGNLISEVQCNASLVESRCLDQQPSHVFYFEFTRCSNTNDALYDSLRSKCHFTLFILWAGVNVDEYEEADDEAASVNLIIVVENIDVSRTDAPGRDYWTSQSRFSLFIWFTCF